MLESSTQALRVGCQPLAFDVHRQRFAACRALRGQRFPNMEPPLTSFADDCIARLVPAP